MGDLMNIVLFLKQRKRGREKEKGRANIYLIKRSFDINNKF